MRWRASDWVPPVVARALTRQSRYETRFIDGLDSWQDAVARAGGYDEEGILDRVLHSTREVVSGRAVAERDGVTLGAPEIRWPVVGALLNAARESGGLLSVLDFGGSLGSTYRQHHALLSGMDLRWNVVEQPAFSASGREFEDGTLRFFDSITGCIDATSPTVVLFSSVLQYLPDPHAVIREAQSVGARAIIIDRTPMTAQPEDIPVVQVAPPALYPVSYPAWLMSHERLVTDFTGWHLVDEFAGIEPDSRSRHGIPIRWRGMIWQRDLP